MTPSAEHTASADSADAEEDALPRGDRELPLLICDRAFTADAQFGYPSLDPSLRAVPGVEPDWAEGVLGDIILVNGAPWPVADVDAARYRLALEPGGVSTPDRLRRRRGAHGPGPNDAGWRDTVDLRPAEQVTLAVRFTDYPGRYVMHCHNLEHEDMAMMCVIAPSTSA